MPASHAPFQVRDSNLRLLACRASTLASSRRFIVTLEIENRTASEDKDAARNEIGDQGPPASMNPHFGEAPWADMRLLILPNPTD